jgi:hypothetical protein
MNHISLTALVWFSLAVSIAVAVPARPLYEPEEPPKPAVRIIADLNGSAWTGKYNTINRIFIFEADGTLSYKSTAATGKIFKNRGSWKLEGDVLSFEHFINPNAKLMQFRGKITDANSIVGESVLGATGAKSQQTLQRTTLNLK